MISNTQAFIYGMELATLALCCMYPAKTLEFVDYLLYNLQVNTLILSVRGCNLYLYVRGWMMYPACVVSLRQWAWRSVLTSSFRCKTVIMVRTGTDHHCYTLTDKGMVIGGPLPRMFMTCSRSRRPARSTSAYRAG